MDTRLKGFLEGLGAEAVELQRGLTAIPAIAPSSGGEGELDKALWLEQVLSRMSFDSLQRLDKKI